jgi:hypothetical protein
MRLMRTLLVITAAALALAGCAKGGLGSKKGPDELAISRNAPLVVPQDFNLVPPAPGSPRAASTDSQAAAMEALFGPGVKPPPKSPAEQQLLDKAGAGNVDPAIRSNAGDPKTPTVNKGAFLREIMDAPVKTQNSAVAAVSIPG